MSKVDPVVEQAVDTLDLNRSPGAACWAASG